MTELDIKKALRDAGFRATKPRISFLETISGAKKPLSIADIADRLTGKADFVTAYRIAESFERAGLIRHVDLRAGKAFYEFSDRAHHHHIVCTDCGKIEDVETCVPEVVSRSVVAQSRSFTSITSHALEFFGVCKTCVYA